MTYISISYDDIRTKIAQGWGLGRLFRWARDKYSLHGESMILAAILKEKNDYTESTIRRVCNETLEKLDMGTKDWLYSLGGLK